MAPKLGIASIAARVGAAVTAGAGSNSEAGLWTGVRGMEAGLATVKAFGPEGGAVAAEGDGSVHFEGGRVHGWRLAMPQLKGKGESASLAV